MTRASISNIMTDEEIKESYEQNGFVVVENIIDESKLDPMRDFIKASIDKYAREQYAKGNFRRSMKTSPSSDATPLFARI